MRPEDAQITPGSPRGSIQPPSRSDDAAQAAVADIARNELNSIYSSDPAHTENATKPADQSTYRRSHESVHATHQEQWNQYHTAWQDYYQKYYERYYIGAVNQVKEAYETKASSSVPTEPIGSSVSRDEAVEDLRSQLKQRVQASTKKVRSSRHFIPLVAALCVLLVFSILQYNRAIIANVKAYVTPGEIDPQNIVVDPNASLTVGKEPLLIIPKINVNVPVNYDTAPDQASQLKAMESGVAYFGIPGANSKPGQIGNTVISGHSSNDFIESGDYKFVFALLERLKKGDIFYLHYKGIRYTYTVTKTQVVSPTNVRALVYKTDKPMVTLITCTPLGTALNRLLVTATQVSPNPNDAKPAPAAGSSSAQAAMPGNSPTFIERLFGG